MTDENKPIQIKYKDKTLTLNLDIPAMRKLRRYEEPIDIMKVIDYQDPSKGLIAQLQDNPGIAVDIAYEATYSDPNRPSDPTEFAKGLSGDALHEIKNAALEAVIRFTPDRKVRTALLAVKDKAAQAQEALGDRMIQAVNDGTIDKALEDAQEQIRAEAGKTAGQQFIDNAPKSTSKTGSAKAASGPGSSTTSKKEDSKGTQSATSKT